MNSNLSRKIAFVLIIAAVAGTEVSYHLTLESRFNTIEEKMQQDATAMAQMQDSIDTLTASKTQSVSDLNKQLSNLQSSFEPLGKTSQAQADALTQLRTQITTLQQAQTTQQDAQKKLSDYIAQLQDNVKKARAEAAAAAVKPAPTTVSAPAPAVPAPQAAPVNTTVATPNLLPPPVATSDLMSTPGAISHADMIEAPSAPEPTPASAPRALPVTASSNTITGVDIRPADSTTATTHSNRALPVGTSLSSKD